MPACAHVCTCVCERDGQKWFVMREVGLGRIGFGGSVELAVDSPGGNREVGCRDLGGSLGVGSSKHRGGAAAGSGDILNLGQPCVCWVSLREAPSAAAASSLRLGPSASHLILRACP